ncbi:MAG: hypothetical protein OXU41_05910 [Gammaproteobacteria bacterium]|nr:hypothetical protein [Gammaproteobacteria bacterium]
MDTPLPAAFASHFTAKVAATCSLVSIIVFLLFASPADESALFTPVGLCVLHAFLALLLFVLEHRHAIREGAPGKHTAVSLVLLYICQCRRGNFAGRRVALRPNRSVDADTGIVMRIMQKTAFLLAAVWLAQAALADGEQVAVKQGRFLIYSSVLSDAAQESNAESIDFEVVKTHTGWKKFFAELGLIYPFFQVKLSVLADGGEAPVKEAHWEFPKEYFFPEEAGDIAGTDVLVNVWRSFPVTAHVSFADGSEKTVRKWIDPEAYLAQQ